MKFNGHILAQEYSIQVHYTAHTEADHKEQPTFLAMNHLLLYYPEYYRVHY